MWHPLPGKLRKARWSPILREDARNVFPEGVGGYQWLYCIPPQLWERLAFPGARIGCGEDPDLPRGWLFWDPQRLHPGSTSFRQALDLTGARFQSHSEALCDPEILCHFRITWLRDLLCLTSTEGHSMSLVGWAWEKMQKKKALSKVCWVTPFREWWCHRFWRVSHSLGSLHKYGICGSPPDAPRTTVGTDNFLKNTPLICNIVSVWVGTETLQWKYSQLNNDLVIFQHWSIVLSVTAWIKNLPGSS